MTLVEFIAPLAQSTYGNKVLAILYYYARYEDTPAMTVEQIRAGLRRARVRNTTKINVGDVLSKSGANVDTAGTEGSKKLWTLTPTGEKAVRSLLGLPEAEPEIEVDVATLTKLVDTVADKKARDFLTEAVTCLQFGALRASVVFVWSGAVTVLRAAAWKSGAAQVNAALLAHDPKARKVGKLDDFAYVNDVRLLEVLFDLGMIDKTEKTILGRALDLRNSCGHPNELPTWREASVRVHRGCRGNRVPMNYFGRLPGAARRDLLRVLASSSDVRADVIRQFHERGDEGMVEVLTELEADDLLRWQVIDVLADTIR